MWTGRYPPCFCLCYAVLVEEVFHWTDGNGAQLKKSTWNEENPNDYVAKNWNFVQKLMYMERYSSNKTLTLNDTIGHPLTSSLSTFSMAL